LHALYQEHLRNELNFYSNVDMVRRLGELFAAVASDDSKAEMELNAVCVAIRMLVGHYGGKDSSKQDKLFSTPSEKGAPTPSPSASVKRAGPDPPAPSPKVARDSEGRRVSHSAEEDQQGDEIARLTAEISRLKLEAMERELGSETSSLPGGVDTSGMSLAEAIKVQTETLAKVLAESNNRKRSTVTAVKTEVKWPRLSDEASDTKDVREFYEQFEEVCGMANDCNGMGPQSQVQMTR
jgi:hypothetical protein